MGVILNQGQNVAAKGIVNWFKKANEQLASVVGFAGTGKTFLTHYIMQEINLRNKAIAFVAYTGQASLVLKTNNKEYHCSTIHKLIYEVDLDSDELTFQLVKKDKLSHLKLIVADESSQIDKIMATDLMSFGIPILVIGDDGQLPPLNDDGFNILENPDFRLTEIMRQAAGNPIIHLSMLAREGKTIDPGKYGENAFIFSKQQLRRNKDLMDNLYMRADQVICGYNNTRKRVNNRVRELKGFHDSLPVIGDKLVCTSNNWRESVDDINLVNGMTGTVTRVDKHPDEDKFIKRPFFEIDFHPTFFEDDKKQFRELYLPNEDFTSSEKLSLKRHEHTFFDRFDFGYAVTCHKSQGSQYPNALVINEVLNSELHSKWLYTAITRAQNNLILCL